MVSVDSAGISMIVAGWRGWGGSSCAWGRQTFFVITKLVPIHWQSAPESLAGERE